MNEHLEIERKYLIAMPDPALLKAQPGCEVVRIRQFYLSGGPGGRLREAASPFGTVYWHTVKERVSDMTQVERERKISREEYDRLLQFRDRTLSAIDKIRYRIPVGALTAEIDIFPFWQDRAVAEFELESEDQRPDLPAWLRVIREVTADRRYTNRALAGSVPQDEIDA